MLAHRESNEGNEGGDVAGRLRTGTVLRSNRSLSLERATMMWPMCDVARAPASEKEEGTSWSRGQGKA